LKVSWAAQLALEGEDRNKGELVGMPIGQQPDPIASLVEMLKSGTLAKVSETSLSLLYSLLELQLTSFPFLRCITGRNHCYERRSSSN